MFELNLKNRALSQTTVAYNSMAKCGDKYLGCTDAGLFLIGGYNDHGVQIPMLMRSGMTDFGDGNQKRFRFFYVSGEANGNGTITIFADGVEAGTADIVPSDTGVFDVRIPISRAHQARYWSWQVENTAGAFIALYSVKALPIILHSGRARG